MVLSCTCWAKSRKQHNEISLWTSGWPCRWLAEGFNFVLSFVLPDLLRAFIASGFFSDKSLNLAETRQTPYKHCTGTADIVQTLYGHCKEIVETLCGHCINTLQTLFTHCTHIVQTLFCHCTNIVETMDKTLYGHCANTAQSLCTNIAHTVRSHCTATVQALLSKRRCAGTVQTLCRLCTDTAQTF